jgi:hypothetical protein
VALSSNSYMVGLSARSILIGRVNLPCGVCGVYTVADTVADTVVDIHMLTQDLARRPTSS